MKNITTPFDNEITLDETTLASASSRRAFLGTIMAGAAAATVLAAGPVSALAAPALKGVRAIPAGDAAILNFALTLEHLETAFYETAAQHFKSGYLGRLVSVLRFDEQQHVAGLTAALQGAGVTPVAKAPRYNFPNVFGSKKDFLNFAATLEDTGVHAYLGQAGLIQTPAILLTAASIVTVEARHTGAVRAMLQRNPTDGAFDKGSTKEQIVAIVTPLIGH